MEHFKAGDKVYCPYIGNKVYTIIKTFSASSLMIETEQKTYPVYKGGIFCFAGFRVFPATLKNRELLEELYKTSFESVENSYD